MSPTPYMNYNTHIQKDSNTQQTNGKAQTMEKKVRVKEEISLENLPEQRKTNTKSGGEIYILYPGS